MACVSPWHELHGWLNMKCQTNMPTRRLKFFAAQKVSYKCVWFWVFRTQLRLCCGTKQTSMPVIRTGRHHFMWQQPTMLCGAQSTSFHCSPMSTCQIGPGALVCIMLPSTDIKRQGKNLVLTDECHCQCIWCCLMKPDTPAWLCYVLLIRLYTEFVFVCAESVIKGWEIVQENWGSFCWHWSKWGF